MPIDVLMPALSPTMTEGNLVRWLKAEGDAIESGDIIAEIETDKATMEVEAIDEGTLGKIFVEAGTESVPVNKRIAVILEEGESAGDIQAEGDASPAPKAETKPELEVVSEHKQEKSGKKAPAQKNSSPQTDERIFASPLARRIATNEGIDLSTLEGSGPKGRIIKTDVLATDTSSAAPAFTPLESPSLTGFEPSYETLETSNMRKVIAKRLVEAKGTVPHFYLTVECEIDNLLAARKDMNVQGDGEFKLSVNDIIIKACAMALKAVPAANASWIDGKIIQYASSDVSVAVATDGGLIAPVICEAQTKGLVDISNEMKDLAKKARENKLKPQEFQGGTFSLSNLGMFGIKEFSAIINPPQGCILAVGAGEQRPVVKNGELTIATVMSCTLSVDHRVVDGAVGAEFLKAFKGFIEQPVSMML